MRTRTNLTTPLLDRPHASPLATLVRRAKAAWTAIIGSSFSRQALNRRVLYRLSRLSERELEDIGLTRHDLAAAELSENGDATQYLVARQHERRTRGGYYPL